MGQDSLESPVYTWTSHSQSQVLLQVPHFHGCHNSQGIFQFVMLCWVFNFYYHLSMKKVVYRNSSRKVISWFVFLSHLFLPLSYKIGGFPVACDFCVLINNSKCTCFCGVQELLMLSFFRPDLTQIALQTQFTQASRLAFQGANLKIFQSCENK